MRSVFSTVAVALLVVGCVSRAQIEMESADQFAQMKASMPVTNSVTDKAYVRCVVNAIVKQLEEPYASYDWEIEVFDNDAINAFAMPGGKIGVFTGIFTVATTQDELGAVLGHEVAHVTRDHSLERANRTMITQNTAVIGSEIFDASTGWETTDMAVMAADLGLLRPYGRGQETEADLIGLQYMAAAGFDPRASIALWINMGKATPLAPPEFLSTHPSGESRIAGLIEDLPAALPLYNAALDAGQVPRCRR